MKFTWPESLPVTRCLPEIEAAARSSQVVVVSGETGSGKTTQLPKLALAMGRAKGSRLIGCTQPRRLATVTVAMRLADELGDGVGGIVGYQHRFERKLSEETKIKFMTDGVLLSEARHDPLLRRYDTIIVDEAHERSLNIDFLLGIVKRILPKRRDLKVIISSATMDCGAFAGFFPDAKIVSVPGKTYPVEIRYRPPPEKEEYDLPREVALAVSSLPAEGDILVFLPGERDIRECAEALSLSTEDDVIPLMASLPPAEQQRAFRPSAKRRIILSTNVAETSLTIPGVRHVVDSGLARISRYVHRTQISRLQIEPVSQASANQRAGRCGRVAPGICIRLYGEDDFCRREKFTPPEILRTSLAGVILQMADIGLGSISSFPFVTPPERQMIREGERLLLELGAITLAEDGEAILTQTGRKLASLPVGPRIGKMILAADREASLASVIPVAAFMACENPRLRPQEERNKAEAAHKRFKNDSSDFLSILALWKWWTRETESVSGNRARKLARANYLSYMKMRQWSDTVAEIRQNAKRLKLDAEQDTGGEEGFHRALLSGLLGRIGKLDRESGDYVGAGGVRFRIFPGSNLFKKSREWIVSGELLDISRLYAMDCAAIEPEWIEKAAAGILKRSYHSISWDAKNGFTRAMERITVYGLVVVEGRRCDYGRIDPDTSREIFLRDGIIGGLFPNPPKALQDNFAVIGEMKSIAQKERRPELFDEDGLLRFFDGAIPKGICSAHSLKKWLGGASRAETAAFRLKREEWIKNATCGEYPDEIAVGGVKMHLTYSHSDDGEKDGITCTVKARDAGALRKWRADWLVPGAIREKLFWMISYLPAQQRKILSPAEDTVSRLSTYLKKCDGPLKEALKRVLFENWGLTVKGDPWNEELMPSHLRVRYRITEDNGRRLVAQGRNLDEVLAKAGESVRGCEVWENKDKICTSWDFGALPVEETVLEGGWSVSAYPCIADRKTGVVLVKERSRAAAEAIHKEGVARLFLIAGGKRIPKGMFHAGRPPVEIALWLAAKGISASALDDDIAMGCAIGALFAEERQIRSKEAFEAIQKGAEARMRELSCEYAGLARSILEKASKAETVLEKKFGGGGPTPDDARMQLDWLLFPGFFKKIPLSRLKSFPRYLDALLRRLEKASVNPGQDAKRLAGITPHWERYRAAATGGKLRQYDRKALVEYRWMVEEFRVSVFAQEVGTPAPVSAKRLDQKWSEAQRGGTPS